jgi:hypothetical protein
MRETTYRNSITQKSPECPSCSRVFKPGISWAGANFCRGAALLRFIDAEPGLSAWELSRISGIPYTDTTRGLAKLREYEAVTVEAEGREAGGFRYRRWPTDKPEGRESFLAVLRRVEGLNDGS